MTDVYAPATKLDAVNHMLASIGQAPVSTLSVTGIRDVNTASLALDMNTRSILNKGWSFNTDYEWELAVDGNSEVLVPAAALWVDPCDRTKDFVVRYDSGTAKLWDREEKSYTIADAVEVDIIWGLDFEEVPQVARDYIMVRAARIWQSQIIGSDLLFKFTEMHEREAFANLSMLEARTKQTNMLAREPIFNRRRNVLR